MISLNTSQISIGLKNQSMSKFKVGDRVRVIKEHCNRYVGHVDTIEQVLTFTSGYYLKNCYLKFDGDEDDRLWFTDFELEPVEDFYWMKKSINV